MSSTEEEIAELRALFDIQHRRMREATKRWQRGHPEIPQVELLWPDLGEMLYWLLERNTELEDGASMAMELIQSEIRAQRAAVLEAHPGVVKTGEVDTEQILSELSFYVAGVARTYQTAHRSSPKPPEGHVEVRGNDGLATTLEPGERLDILRADGTLIGTLVYGTPEEIAEAEARLAAKQP